MNRGTVAALVLSCAALGSVPALAGPTTGGPSPVDSGRMAAASVSVPLPGGDTLNLDIRAAQMSAGDQLSIHAQRCSDDEGCFSDANYVSPLTDAEVSIDPTTAIARLHATLDGRDLDVAWRPANGAVLSAGYIDGGGSSAVASSYGGDAAEATVQYAGSTCATSGAVGQEFDTTVALAGDSATAPIETLQLPPGATLHCTS